MHQALILLLFVVLSPERLLSRIFKLLRTDKGNLPKRKTKLKHYPLRICKTCALLLFLFRNYNCADYDNNQHTSARDFA